MVKRESGVVMMDLLCTIAILTILSSFCLTGGRARFANVGACAQRLRISRAASSRIERLRAEAAPPAPGRRPFPVETPGLVGEESVREREPGLLEVTVSVRPADGGPAVAITTLFAREEAR